MTYRSGTDVATHVATSDDAQIQPNGVDLTIEAAYRSNGGRIDVDGKTIGDRQELEPTNGEWSFCRPVVVEYGETIAIPEEHIGFVYPRSSLLRNLCELHTAVWDAGYEGRGEGLLVPHAPIAIERGARVGQLVYASADHDDLYDGDYQGERLDDAAQEDHT